jgi:hypothetical protein
MKAQYKILAAVIATLACGTAFADLPQKAATRIEFNSMIDQNNADKQDLQKTVAGKADDDSTVTAAVPADKKKVMDLVDVEVGVVEDRPVVMDRRYNSVSAPVVAPEFSNAKVQLVDPKKSDSGT